MLKHVIIEELNQNYGLDLLDFEKCKEICLELREKKSKLESELNPQNPEGTIGKTLNKSKQIVNKANEVVSESKTVLKEVEVNLEELDGVRRQVQNYFNKLNSLQTVLQYMKVVQRIELFSSELEREITKKDADEQCATIYANLCEISRNLIDSNAKNLRNYLKETVHYWHNVLKQKLAKDFDDVLTAIKWPFVSANFSLQTPSSSCIQRLQIISEYLLQIQLPTELITPTPTSPLLADFRELCLPICLLVEPLRKRFFYHFYGTRQTNRIDKPEWYFTQILTWIRDHCEFVVKWLQPVVDRLGYHHIDVKLELMRGLIQLGVEKLHSDLPQLQYDDYNFSHSIDEALCFDKELHETYNYPRNQPGILIVLTQAQVFIKWLTMEKKFAVEKMDTILSDIEAFEVVTTDLIDDLKITTCADAFITLLQTITERYTSLQQPGHRLQFLELQLELLDDFRVRLLQLVNAEQENVIESKIPMIANTVYYIENVLIDWGTMLHYLNLFHYKSQLENVEILPPQLNEFELSDIDTETVFVDTISLYRRMKKDLLYLLTEFVMYEVKIESKRYRKEV